MNTSTTDQLLQRIEQTSRYYSDAELETFSIGYLRNFLNRFSSEEENMDPSILGKIEMLIEALPLKSTAGDWNTQEPKFKNIAELKDEIRKKYNFVPKGHYKRVFLPLGVAIGIPLGLPIGAAMGNIALGLPLGIPFGIPIGLAIGTRLDRIAEKEQRAL